MISSPCKVFWSMNCVYSQNSTVLPHSHEYFHYLYVKSGSGTIDIDTKSYALIPGHIYIMARGIRHSIYSGENGLSAYEIKFNTVDKEKRERLERLPHKIELVGCKAEDIFENIFTEMQNMDVYYERVVEALLEQLIFILIRSSENNREKRTTTYSQKFSDVLFYMNQNLSKEITLKTLADIVHMEKIYFLKSFKAAIGATPMDYLRRLRINKAKKLLANSDMNITQISSAVGFQTIHHFTGVFKKSTGKSPTEYKLEKKNKTETFL